MGGSLIRSLLLVTESGLNVFEHFVSESQLSSSQLISGMYTAFFTFFEREMAKGNVRSIELSRTKIIVFSHYDLSAIIEFERYCEESSISVLTEKVRAIITTIIPQQHQNPNKYIALIEQAHLQQIFTPKWQQQQLLDNQINNLLDIISIKYKGETIHEIEIQKHYESIIQLGSETNYTIVCELYDRNIVLSHIRLITEFLSIIQPTSPMVLPYFLPYYQEKLKGTDFDHILISYAWILPEAIETLLIKKNLVIVGGDTITQAIGNILESLDLRGAFSISPHYQLLSPDDRDYDIIRMEEEPVTQLPLINLYTKEAMRMIRHSYMREYLGGKVKTGEVMQALQQVMLRLEEYHQLLFDEIFQVQYITHAKEVIEELREQTDAGLWNLALHYFDIKTPFLMDKLFEVTAFKRTFGLGLTKRLTRSTETRQPILWTKMFQSVWTRIAALVLSIIFFIIIFSFS